MYKQRRHFISNVGLQNWAIYHNFDQKCYIFVILNILLKSTRAIIDRMSATALRNSKEAFDNLIWGFNLGPRFPSIGINRTDTFLSLIRVDHENLKLLRPKTKINKIWTIWTNFDSSWAPKWTPMLKNIAKIITNNCISRKEK